ncbi:hypothetical protein EVA_07636 [gut metagenome]|uniref:Uncharacterized protein n=1 Tax=gut metagenome TaxID=749906 RepID=J9GUU3_9ZZZZ
MLQRLFDLGLLVYDSYIVDPEGIANAADIGTAVAGVELEDDVGRFLVGICPSNFFYLYHFPFAVLGVFHVVARGQSHIGLIEGSFGDVTIVDGELGIVDPVVCGLVKALYHRTNAFGIDATVGIFPAFLQEEHAVSHIHTFDFAHRTETRLADSVGLTRQLYLVVEAYCFRAKVEGDAGIEFAHWILGAGNGFLGGSEVD